MMRMLRSACCPFMSIYVKIYRQLLKRVIALLFYIYFYTTAKVFFCSFCIEIWLFFVITEGCVLLNMYQACTDLIETETDESMLVIGKLVSIFRSKKEISNEKKMIRQLQTGMNTAIKGRQFTQN